MFGRTGERPDPAAAARQRSVLLTTAAREAPRLMVLLVGIIVVFDMIAVFSGMTLPASYLMSDVIQSGVFLISAYLVGRRLVPPAAVPWLFGASIVVNNAATNFQFTFDTAGAGMGVVVILAAAYGAVILFWRPFIVAAIAMVLITGYTLSQHLPEYEPAWMLTYLTALGVSAALLYGRRQGGLALARATLATEAMATTDQLTGLLNRFGLRQAGERLSAVARRNGEPITAVFVDIAGLKGVNDGRGHDAGDAVLVATARALVANSRESDLVCRWGGDEFLVIGIGEQREAEEFGRRVVSTIDDSGLAWQARLHVGSASDPDGDLDAVIQAADHAMSKQTARPDTEHRA